MSEHDPELDPEQEERLRALLADLGSTGDGAEPLPADVTARLEDTLAGLVAERGAQHLSEEHNATGAVVALRPRWMPRLAAGAAAVIVLGLGGLAAVNLGHPGASSSPTSADSAARSTESQPLSGSASAGTAAPEVAGTSKSAAGLPQLSSADFGRGVHTLLEGTPSLRAPARVYGQQDDRAGTPSPFPGVAAGSACAGPRSTDGATVTPVSLDSAPAALVVHPAKGGRQLVEAWSCDGSHRLASATIAP